MNIKEKGSGISMAGTNAVSAACPEHLLGKLCTKTVHIKMLPFTGSSFCSCFLYVVYGVCTLISSRLTVFQKYFHRPVELHSVQCTALIYHSQIVLIWVCLHGLTCTERSFLDVLQGQSFSSHCHSNEYTMFLLCQKITHCITLNHKVCTYS